MLPFAAALLPFALEVINGPMPHSYEFSTQILYYHPFSSVITHFLLLLPIFFYYHSLFSRRQTSEFQQQSFCKIVCQKQLGPKTSKLKSLRKSSQPKTSLSNLLDNFFVQFICSNRRLCFNFKKFSLKKLFF